MIPLIASVTLVVIGGGGLILVAITSKKPHDRLDVFGVIFFTIILMLGILRLVVLAFS